MLWLKKRVKNLKFTQIATQATRRVAGTAVYLQLSRVHADVDVLVGLAAVLQVVKGFDLVQGVQQAPAEEADPQHAGRVNAKLEAVQLSVQVGGRHWRSRIYCYHH